MSADREKERFLEEIATRLPPMDQLRPTPHATIRLAYDTAPAREAAAAFLADLLHAGLTVDGESTAARYLDLRITSRRTA